MSETLKKREDIPEEYKWKLEDLYASDEEWEREFALACEGIKELGGFAGKLGDASMLLAFLRKQDEIGLWLDRLIVYSNQKLHQDMSVSVYQGLTARAQSLAVAYGSAVSFAEPELLSLPQGRIEEMAGQQEGLALYEIYFEEIMRKKAHTLSVAEEAILAQAVEVAAGPQDVFSMFNNVDISLGTAIDSEGNEHPLTNGNYVTKLLSGDRKLRETAFRSCYKAYGAFRNTLAANYLANVKQAKFFACAHKYESSLAAALDRSQIPVPVYTSLIEAVHDRLPDMYRYVALRKKVLGVSELHMYDVYVPLADESSVMKLDYEEAKAYALKGLAPMGEEYLAILQESFENRWIDVYETPNKRGGAYSWGAYGTHPYALLNYQGTLDDLFTLVHEMGHSIHTYYSNKNQPFIYSGYRIFVAEVASTCNEALMMHYLLEHTEDQAQRRYLINHFLDQFKGTLFRQTMFAEFEKITHEKYGNGESLTTDEICEIYLNLNRLYFGDEMISDEEIAMEWARIPHFYNEFYVYQYATGFSAAIALSRRILKEGAPAVEDYKRFLSGGCSKSPIELLKIAGVDLSSPEPVKAALDYFGELVTELEGLV